MKQWREELEKSVQRDATQKTFDFLKYFVFIIENIIIHENNKLNNNS